MIDHVVFGGSGFIGTHLAQAIHDRSPTSTIVDVDLQPPKYDRAIHHIADVRNPLPRIEDIGSQTILYNLAAIHRTPGHPDKDYFETNIRGAENVCDFARQAGIRAIVFTSSIAPYGASEEGKTENSLPMPNTPYGISKLIAEKIHLAWQAEHPDNRLLILRPGIVFGTGEGGNFTRLHRALSKGVFAYAGRRDTRKACIYVKDLVRVMLECIPKDESRVHLFNCCYPVPPSIQEIVEAMKSATGIKRYVPMVPAPLLKFGAGMLSALDAMGLGIHPDRVRKLMVSTNISGSRLHSVFPLRYTLKEAILDWHKDCAGSKLK